MRLLLFDIDGTLIQSNRAGRLALGAALKELFGTTGLLDSYEMGGKTDALIITEILSSIGIAPEKIEKMLPEVYALMAAKAQEIYPQRDIAPCPGVIELLESLDGNQEVLLGLLTGNSHLTTPLKLKAAGIDPDRFAISAFGSEALDRNSLPALAMERARRLTGVIFTGDNTVIIGDTPADILCARAGKATAVAVASGWHSAAALADYHPDFLFDDFQDVPSVIAVLLGSKGGKMSGNKIELAGIKFNDNRPTLVSIKNLYRWVIWQFPRVNKDGFQGAICPPLSESIWIPAVINPEKKRVKVFAHLQKKYNSPEEALDFFNQMDPV